MKSLYTSQEKIVCCEISHIDVFGKISKSKFKGIKIDEQFFNPITYGILTFRQLRGGGGGGGLFGPDPENKVTVNGLI